MTPYRERRAAGLYDPQDRPREDADTTSESVGGLTRLAPEPAESTIAPVSVDYWALTKGELIELARERGVKPANHAMSKDELVEGLSNAE